MGEARKDTLPVYLHFMDLRLDNRIKLEFHGAAVMSDAGPVAYPNSTETDWVFPITRYPALQDGQL